MPVVRLPIVCLVLLAALLAPAGASAALPADTTAPGCPAAVDCSPPTDTTNVAGGGTSTWTRTNTVTMRATEPMSESGVDHLEWAVDGTFGGTVAYGATVTFGPDGVRQFSHRAVDRAGNSSPWVTETVWLDTTAPSDATPTPSAAWSPTSPVVVSLLGTDVAGGSGLDRLEYRLDGAAPVGVPSGSAVPVTGDGAHTLLHRAVDGAGNASPWVSDTVRIDTSAPSDTTTVPAGWAAGTATVVLDGTDPWSGVDLVRYRVAGGPAVTAAPGTQLAISTSGVSTIETQVVDKLGNTSPWRANTVRVDTSDPVDTTGVPAGWQTASPVVVTGSGTDAQSGITKVEWMLDDPTVHSVAGPTATINVGTDGDHVLQTRVTDGSGRQTAWRSATIRVDTTKPTNGTQGPAGWSRAPVDVLLDGADGGSGLARISWSLDGGVVTNGVKGTPVRVGTDGVHALTTTAYDVAGLSTPVTTTVRVDQTPPVDTTSVASRVPYGPVTASGTDLTSGVARLEWEVDGVAGTGASVALGRPGSHTFKHRVVDVAGNESSWVTQTVVVDPALNGDVTAPVDTTSTPSGWRTTPTVTVAVTGTDADTAVDTVAWRANGQPVQTGASPSSVTFTGDGVHEFDTRVTDLVGNASPWTTRTVRIDGTVPTDTTDVPATGWQAADTVTVAGTDATSGVDHVEWAVDGAASQSSATGVASATTPALAEGTHTVRHRVVDAAGNASAWVTSTVKVDTTAPADTTAALPAGWQLDAVSVAPQGTDARSGVAAVEAELDGAAVTARPVVIGADGTHVLRTRVRDAAGNVTPWRSQTVLVDRRAPADTTAAVGDGWHTGPVLVSPAADDGAGSGVAALEHRVGDGAPAAGDVTVSAEGATTVATRATDAVGHVADWREQVVRVDTVAPVAGVSCAPDAAPTGYRCRVAGADATSGLAALRYRVDGGAWKAVAPDATVPVDRGLVEAEAVDAAGLTGRAEPVTLAARVAPVTEAAPSVVRTRRVTVSRRGSKGPSGYLGSFVLRTSRADGGPLEALADARPLSLGKGRHRVTLHLTAGQLTAKRVKVVSLPGRGGYSPRIGVALSGVKQAMTATLTVERRRGKRWTPVATAVAHLKP